MLPRTLLLLLLSLPASALFGGVLTAGPERLLGNPDPRPMPPGVGMAPALATDGRDIALFWLASSNRLPASFDLYAIALGPDGRPLTLLPRRIVEALGYNSAFRVFWHEGHYVVFHGAPAGVQLYRVTRNLELADRRTVTPGSFFSSVQQVGDEFVVYANGAMTRLGSDFRPIGVRVRLPEGASFVAAAPEGRFALVNVREPVPTMRLYDGRTFSELIRLEPGVSGIFWTGTEFILQTGTAFQRYDRDLTPVGSPVKLERTPTAGSVTATPLSDGSLWLQWHSSFNQWGQRLRPGESIPPRSYALGGPTVPVRTSDDRVLLVDVALRVAEVPPVATDAAVSWTPAVFHATAELVAGAGASPAELAVVRFRNVDGGIATVMNHEGFALREHPVGGNATAIATDGKDLYAFNSAGFRKLVPGATTMGWVAIGTPGIGLVWSGTDFTVAWNFWIRLERITTAGERLIPCIEVAAGAREHGRATPTIAGGDGIVLVVWAGRMAWFRDGCPITETFVDPLLSAPHRLAWNDGRWALAFTENGSLRIAITGRRRPFVPNPGEIARVTEILSFTAAGDGWAVLYGDGSRVLATLLDRDGNPVASGIVSHEPSKGALVSLPDGRLVAAYSRVVRESPYFNVPRVFIRHLTVDEPVRRRGVRH